MSFLRRRKHDGDRTRWERGQAMIEMALLLPFVFVLLLLVIEFGFLMWSHLNINAAAREAVRAAAVGKVVKVDCGADSVQERALAASLERIDCTDVVEVGYADPDDNGFGRGDEVVVRIKHPYKSLTPIFSGSILGINLGVGNIVLRACADARLEQTYPGLAPGEDPSHWDPDGTGTFTDCRSN